MLTQGEGAARLIGGKTAKSLSEGFVTLQTAGIRELAEQLEALAARVGSPKEMEKVVLRGAKIIETGYAQRVGDVTGNLKKSIDHKIRVYENPNGGNATVAIVGPKQTGNRQASEKDGSGNAAWLVEFGSGTRRPGTKGRRTYVNVHQMINGRMRRHSSANDQQFRNMARGYYFLMGSKNEPSRQARDGTGYPHDFGYTDGRQHPVTLHPGDTYAPMPAKHPMERTINAEQQRVFNTLEAAIKNSIDRLSQ